MGGGGGELSVELLDGEVALGKLLCEMQDLLASPCPSERAVSTRCSQRTVNIITERQV